MPKVKSLFICQNCGANSAKWIGKCPSCDEWNTYVEEIIEKTEEGHYQWDKEKNGKHVKTNKPVRLGDVVESDVSRISTKDEEFDRVLGGGIVPGSVILIGGEPGIGKSTLMLQLAMTLSGVEILYVTGEESIQQIKLRANRLKNQNDNFHILSETSTKTIFKHAKKLNPQLIIVDSIQTLHSSFIESAPGSVSQIRECAGELQRFAKETDTSVFLVGHITKDGSIAGPKVLEHIVDTVLQFEGDRNHVYRILRTSKNRFGSTSELGIYQMNSSGLHQVQNPSEILITEREDDLSGISIAATIEGVRSLLIETQALVSRSYFPSPQRTSTGFDLKRLHMLLAVLEKRCGYNLSNKDVFLNIAGGLKVDDPAIDLSVASSIISSYEDIPVKMKTCFSGEIGLSGEIRAVGRIDQRILEAEKLGFERMFISKYNLKSIDKKRFKIEIKAVSKLQELKEQLFLS